MNYISSIDEKWYAFEADRENGQVFSIGSSNLKGYISHDYETLNREKLYRHYDGMMVWMGDNWHELHNNFLFWMWDVDSIVIWNPDVIISK